MSKVTRNAPKRSSASESRLALFEFERDFPDDATCLDYLVKMLYPNGIYCPTCKRVTKHHRDRKRPSYACQFCGHREHPMVGTIFQDSATSLRLWFYAIYLMISTRCGVSAKQLERELGVTYKTAWRMFSKIRSLLKQAADEQMGGTLEMDEAYIGGKRRDRTGRPGRGDPKKMPVFGIAERGQDGQPGRIVAKVVPDVRTKSLMPIVKERVFPSSVVYTDEYQSYATLAGMGFKHSRIHHSQKVYVMGDVHTNTIDGFWALLKHGISGVYHGVSSKWLQAYLDEYAFRYNNQGREMFTAVLSRVRKASAESASGPHA